MVLPPRDLINNPAGDATGEKPASLSGTVWVDDAFCPANGGSSGAGYSLVCFASQLRGPFSVCARAEFAASTAL